MLNPVRVLLYRVKQDKPEKLGLGLSIVKAIVQAHSGQINVESDRRNSYHLESHRFSVTLSDSSDTINHSLVTYRLRINHG